MISFSHPVYLLLLLLAPWLLSVSRRSLAGLRPGRARLALGVRLVVLLLLVLGLAGLQLARPSRSLSVLFLLDYSDSVPRDRQEAALRFIDTVAARMGPHDSAGVIVFGSDAYVEYLPRPGLRVGSVHTVLSREYTDIAGAIRLALAAFPEDAQRRIVLLSDGNENMGSALEEAAAASASGVSVDVVPILYDYDRELLIEKLTAPNEAKQGEPFELKMLATATRDTTARLRVWRDDRLVNDQNVRLLKGKTALAVPQTIEAPGFHRFEARLESPEDTRAENNRALAFTRVQGRPRVLYVEGNRADGLYLARALRGQKVDVDLRGSEAIPTNLAEFQNYDSVISSNVGAWKLTPEQMRMLQSNVRDLGAGLVMLGGDQSFGAGAYGGTPIEAALPVEMDVSKKKHIPTGAVAMVMHSCEFPNGNQWAAETAAGVVEVLGARDHVGVLLYDSGDRWGIPMQPARDKIGLIRKVFQLQPGDMPSFDPIMRLAYDGLRRVDSRIKHIIVLSDGDPSPPTNQLMKACVDAKITVSTIAVFPHDTLAPTLQAMAKIGRGRFYQVTRAAQIPRIFLKEATTVLKPAIIEEPFLPRVDTSSPLLKGVAAASIPPLLGYVAVSPKSLADVPMVTKREDPLLASWQYGLGKAVAFTSDVKNRWAAQWIDWPGYPKFWAQAVRWTVRSTSRTPLETSVEIDRRRGKITIDAVDTRGSFLNFLDLKGNVVTPERTLKLQLQQTAPGRYEGTFDAPDVGQYIVSVGYRDPDGRQRLHSAGAAVPYSPEYRELRANETTLARLAEATGGRMHAPLRGTGPTNDQRPTTNEPTPNTASAASTIFRRDWRARTAPREVWPLLLLIAALLFPLDVAVRRLMIEPAEARAHAARARERLLARLTGRRRAPDAHDPALGRLLRRKEEVGEQIEETATSTTPPSPAGRGAGGGRSRRLEPSRAGGDAAALDQRPTTNDPRTAHRRAAGPGTDDRTPPGREAAGGKVAAAG